MYFLQENGNLVRVIEQSYCDNNKYTRKFNKISKKYAQPTDMYVDINYGVCNQIFEKDDYEFLQFELDIKSQNLDDKEEIRKSFFHVQTKKMKIVSNDLSMEVARPVHKNTLNLDQEGSGCVVSGIRNLRVDY